MPQTDLDVCNQAAGKAGAAPFGSFTEAKPVAYFCKANYPQKKAELLGLHRWVFAKTIVQLTQITPTPANAPFAFAFARPADVVGAFHDFRCGPKLDSGKVHVLQLADYIAADHATVWAEYTANVPEAQWPPWFTALVVTAFGAGIARAALRRGLAGDLDVEAFGTPEQNREGGLMLTAKTADSQNAPKRELTWEGGGALVEARFGGAWPGPSGLRVIVE